MSGIINYLNNNKAWNTVGCVPGIGTIAGLFFESATSAVAYSIIKSNPPKSNYSENELSQKNKKYFNSLMLEEVPNPEAYLGITQTRFVQILGSHLSVFLTTHEFGFFKPENSLSSSDEAGRFKESIDMMKMGSEVYFNSMRSSGMQSENEIAARKKFYLFFLDRILQKVAAQSTTITKENVNLALMTIYSEVEYCEGLDLAAKHMKLGAIRATWLGSMGITGYSCAKEPVDSWAVVENLDKRVTSLSPIKF